MRAWLFLLIIKYIVFFNRVVFDSNIGRFYTRGRIMRLDELGQTFVIRLVIRLKYKDGHKTHYPSRRAILCCAT